MDKMDFLKKVPIFNELATDELLRIKRIGSVMKVPKQELVFDENTSGGKFYIVSSGRVKIFTSSGAKKKTLAYLEKGEFFGEMALLDAEPRSASSEAIDDCELFVIKKNDFKKLLIRHPNISFHILKTLSKRLRQADREIEGLTFGNVIGRIAATLLDLSARYGERNAQGCRIKMSLSHKDIAELAGTGREMVSRILNRLKRLNCVSYSSRHVIITDEQKLRQWVK
jgi:CRP-like cAMP-binding protein